MERIENACAFTGHRQAKLPWGANENSPDCITLKQQIADTVEAVYTAGIRHYICGMATGCDMYFCEAVIDLRECHEDVSLEAAIPWEKQSDAWGSSLKNRYKRLLEQCDYYTLVQKEYTPDCLMRRNRYMVDNARILIAAYSGKQGGTMSTILYAMRKNLEIIQISLG